MFLQKTNLESLLYALLGRVVCVGKPTPTWPYGMRKAMSAGFLGDRPMKRPIKISEI